jgi:hypothetical protein
MAITKAFQEYIDVFMKIFLDDFIVFNDLSTHLKKLTKCFLKCREYGINLNLDKFPFMVCFGTILGFIVSKEGKTFDLKKIESLVNMSMSKTPQDIEVFNGMAQFYKCFIKKICLCYGTNHQVIQKS